MARTLRTLGTERSLCLRATKVTLVSGQRGELCETQRTRTAHIRQLRSGGWSQRSVVSATPNLDHAALVEASTADVAGAGSSPVASTPEAGEAG